MISGPATVGEGATTSNYTVTLVNAAGATTSATKSTVVFANGSAEAGDYVATPQTLTILSGASSATFTVATNEDADFKRRLGVDQPGSGYRRVRGDQHHHRHRRAAAVGHDDDLRQRCAADDPPINNVTVNEDAGTMTFTVSLSHATTAPVSFSDAYQQRRQPGDGRRLHRHQRFGRDRHEPHHRHLHGGDQR